MRQWLMLITAITLVFAAEFVVAEEKHRHDHGSHEHGGSQVQEHGGSELGAQTVTGEVVDLACYLSEGLKGPDHRECASSCIASGLPVGIKTKDRLYLVMGGEHGPANETLAPLAAKDVTAEGTVSVRDGVYLLAVKKVVVNE